jgi:hypothetical protein
MSRIVGICPFSSRRDFCSLLQIFDFLSAPYTVRWKEGRNFKSLEIVLGGYGKSVCESENHWRLLWCVAKEQLSRLFDEENYHV